MPRWSATMTLSAASLCLAGCSLNDPFPELHPLSGTVIRDGVRVSNGGLLFVAEPANQSGLIVNATVQSDGSFAAQTTYPSDRGGVVRPGVPAGRYRIIYHPLSDGSKTGLEVELDQWVTVDGPLHNIVVQVPLNLSGGNGLPRDQKATTTDALNKDE